MSVRTLSLPLDAALAAAQAALAASPAGTADVWELPAGDAPLAGPLTLGTDAHALTLRGSATRLVLTGGALTLRGARVALEGVAVALGGGAAALRLVSGSDVRVVDVALGASAPLAGAAAALALEAPAGTAHLEDVTVEGVAGDALRAVDVTADALRAAGLRVRGLQAGAGPATALRAVCRTAHLTDVAAEDVGATGGEAVGVDVSARERLDASDVRAARVAGEGAVGLRLLSVQPPPAGDAAAAWQGLAVVDADVEDVAGGGGEALGLVAGTAGPLRVRGFGVLRVAGARATGVLALAGAGLEVALGRAEDVVGTGGAVGVRALAAPSVAAAVVRDVAVARVAGPVPAHPRPPPAWRAWAEEAVALLAGAPVAALSLPALPAAADVAGLHLGAHVDPLSPVLDAPEGPGGVAVEDCALHTVTGTALQLEAGQASARVRRCEAWTAVHGGWAQSEALLLAQLTWHRHAHGLAVGPGEVQAYDALFSALPAPPLLLDADAELAATGALFADVPAEGFRPLGALPYRTPGPPALPAPVLAGALPPPEAVDLRLVPDTALAGAAVPVPGDGEDDPPPFVGAWEPEAARRCELRDPQPRPWTQAPPPPAAGAPVDYRARDAASLLAVMLERARVALPTWRDEGPADFTAMLLELSAAQLDGLAYRQERSVAEGFLEDAQLRRSVEDHVRALDYAPDPGLSATALVRLRVDAAALAARVARRLEEEGLPALPPGTTALEFVNGNLPLELPEGTLVATAKDVEDEATVVFTTEAPLTYLPRLDAVALDEDVAPGDTSATLRGRLPELEEGRWLVLWPGPHGAGAHVVRATEVRLGSDTTWVGWDPRRPARARLAAAHAQVLGNLVPAHHGLPLTPLPPAGVREDADGATDSFDALLTRWRALLRPTVDGAREREVRLPFGALSVWARGYPLPGEEDTRQGVPQLQVDVEGDVWRRVEDLSVHGPSDEVVVLRAGLRGEPVLRFGDGTHGAALPARPTQLALGLSVGLGGAGRVPAGALARLLQVGTGGGRGVPPGGLLDDTAEAVRALLRVDNPLPAVGGREPEPLARMRYRAPLGVGQGLSAVSPGDFVRRLEALPEVAGAAARVVRRGLRQVVRCTVLLADADTLGADELLRRWARVRRVLEDVRLLGFDVEAVPPVWVPLDLDVEVDAAPGAHVDAVRDGVHAAVAGQHGLLDPDVSGLGGDVQLADVYRAAGAVPGVTAVRVRRFRRLAPHAPEAREAGVLPMDADEVATVEGGLRPHARGLLTVTVCGGLR